MSLKPPSPNGLRVLSCGPHWAESPDDLTVILPSTVLRAFLGRSPRQSQPEHQASTSSPRQRASPTAVRKQPIPSRRPVAVAGLLTLALVIVLTVATRPRNRRTAAAQD